MKRITVGVITYNQEDVICRALDSVLKQKDWGLYRIVICDDCSKDRTWDILIEYKAKYPEIVYPHRNEKNLGVYGNLASLESLLPDSDLYCYLSGDDAYCDGYFEGVQKLIEKNGIGIYQAVGIYSDWKSVSPLEKEKVFCQKPSVSGYNLWSLKMRGIITSRSIMISKATHDKFEPIILEQGLALAEGVFDAQPHLHIEQAYYLPMITSIYYSGIGISSKLTLNNSDYYTTQHRTMWQYFIDHYINNTRDLYFAKYQLLRAEYYESPTLKKFIKMYCNYLKGRLPHFHSTVIEDFWRFAPLIKYLLTHH